MPVLCRFSFQRHTMSISDSFYSRHNSKIHQPPPLFQFPIRKAIVRSGTPRSADSPRRDFFSQLRNNSVFGNIKSSAYVSDSAAVESLHFDLLLHAGLPCVISIVMLKTLSVFTQHCRWVPFSLRPFFTESSAPQCRHFISIYYFIMTEQYIEREVINQRI